MKHPLNPPGHPDPVVIDTGPDPRGAVIWLHGLGADGHDFEPIVPELRLAGAPAIRFVFPHAPVRPVTLNGGMAMRAWYDIVQLGGGREDEAGVRQSGEALAAMIADPLLKGLGPERVVLAGFSQGGAVALQAGLRFEQRLAGILALSTYLPIADHLERDRSEANRDCPILMVHGTYDQVIPLNRAVASRDRLVSLGYPVQWHTYPMAHAVCAEEIAVVSGWLRQRLG
jgi:phospholipase/carboxylesterase